MSDAVEQQIEPEEVAPDPEVEEVEADPELIARRDAALAQVRKFGDPVLATKARAVARFDPRLATQVEWMSELMHDAYGIGLAATQVGVLNRVLVYRVQHEGPVNALVNPEIEWHSKEQEIAPEGCLSLPQVHVEVERSVYVRVRAQNPAGEQITIEAGGLEARVIQHEIDHLDGVLILKRTSREERKQALATLRELQDRQ